MSDQNRLNDLRKQALDLFRVGLQAADPAAAVRQALAKEPIKGPAIILAVGKAACAMMSAALEVVEAKTALVVTNYENTREIPGAEVLGAGHPRPDEEGLAAGQRVRQIAHQAEASDQILLLLSGGGSALLPLPVPGVSLTDKQTTNDLMLGAGLAIQEINLVRQNLSQLKGGGLAAMAAPAQVRSLILSDVIGDDLRAIASGPTAEPLGTAQQAREVLTQAGIWEQVPQAAQQTLQAGGDKGVVAKAHNQLIGSNTKSLEAMSEKNGARLMNRALVADVEVAAQQIANDIETTSDPILLWGGETTVNLVGTGKGGRNQEVSLRVLRHLHKLSGPWVFLSGGSDGIDGPTDAAGGLVDSSMSYASQVDQALKNNDAYPALRRLGGLLMTGATGTNVADFQIFIRG